MAAALTWATISSAQPPEPTDSPEASEPAETPESSGPTAPKEPVHSPEPPAAGAPAAPSPGGVGPGVVAPGGFQPGGGRGGFRGPSRTEIKVLDQFDLDFNGFLDEQERPLARSFAKEARANRPSFGPGGRGPGGRGPGGSGPGGRGPGGGRGPFGGAPEQEASPGPQLAPGDVPSYPDHRLYDPTIVRTFFFEFANTDWEEELEDFEPTDVDVPAALTVDGLRLENVGVSFRGTSSYGMVSRGHKRSFNVSIDLADAEARLYGCKTLNLLNSHEDPSFMRTMLFNRVAREYVPACESNFVRVVINGESWGIYVSEEQPNKDFFKKWFANADGDRFKIPPDFSGSSSLLFLGEDVQAYKQRYVLQTKADEQAWERLVTLCKALQDLPDDALEDELNRQFNMDGALWMLALENVLIDGDGYISRGSDYMLYFDKKQNRFHMLTRDSNETFRPPMGPGFGGGFGATMDPLARSTETTRPVMRRLLAIPHIRARYLEYVRTVVDQWLSWDKLGPVYDEYMQLVQAEISADTKKLYTTEAFLAEGATSLSEGAAASPFGLRAFVESRQRFLQDHIEYLLPRPEMADAQAAWQDSGNAFLATVRVAGEVAAAHVYVYHATKRGGVFQRTELFDDGQHADGSPNDGQFAALIQVSKPGKSVRYYFEARSAAEVGTTAFWPATTEQGAMELMAE